jgi:serine/threonine-protein kinase RsbW
MKEEFSLEIPNEAKYVSVARLAASGVASNMNFDMEAVEDIKVSLSEACNCLIEAGENVDKIKIHFKVKEKLLAIEVDCEGLKLGNKCWTERHSLGKTFIETLMDGFKILKKPGKKTSIEMVKFLPDFEQDSQQYLH